MGREWKVAAALVAAAAAVSGSAWGPLHGHASASVSTTRQPVHGDFNGDGYADLAVGVPNGDGGIGAVIVMHGSASGLTTAGSQYWTMHAPGVAGPRGAVGDLFGSSLAVGNFNGDAYADLAIGAPGANGVLVLYGSSQGLSASGSQFLHGGASSGFAVAAGDFNGDGIDDLAVGQPFAKAGGQVAAGSVDVYYGSHSGLSGTVRGSVQQFSEATSGMPAPAPQFNDNFGLALASGHFSGGRYADLAVGVPNSEGYGAVIVLDGSGRGLTTNGAQYLESFSIFGGGGSSLAAGDFNNDGIDDLAVGDPDASTSNGDAGAIEIHYGSLSGLRKAAQGTAQAFAEISVGMPGPATADEDKFGYTLAAGHYNGRSAADLAVGIAGKSAVIVLYGSGRGLTTNNSQYIAGVGPQSTGTFSSEGVAVAGGDFSADGYSDLVLGEPFTATSEPAAGIIEVHPGGAAGVQDTGIGTASQFAEGSAGMAGQAPASNDNFGFAVAAT